MNEKVTGIGGVFFRAKDPAKLSAWYGKHLGVPIEQWGGAQFHARDHKNPKKTVTTVWNPFKHDTTYFGDATQAHMINYRVADLKAMLAHLKKAKVWIDPKSSTEPTEYGKFAWIKDAEGNRIELWEPPAPAKPKKKPAK